MIWNFKKYMSVGSQLKQARTKKGISIQEASAKIKIQEKFLGALEDDDITALPNVLYAKGFLKKYAEFLGLDVDSIIEQFQKTAPPEVEQIIKLEGKDFPSLDSERYLKKLFIGIIAILAVIGLIAFLASSVKKATRRSKRPAVILQQKKVLQRIQAKKISVKPVKPPQPVAVAPTVMLNLSVTAKKPCHLSIKSDDKLLFDNFLTQGQSEQWQAKQVFGLDISDGSAVELALNAKRLGTLSKGPKKNILITKDGLRQK